MSMQNAPSFSIPINDALGRDLTHIQGTAEERAGRRMTLRIADVSEEISAVIGLFDVVGAALEWHAHEQLTPQRFLPAMNVIERRLALLQQELTEIHEALCD